MHFDDNFFFNKYYSNFSSFNVFFFVEECIKMVILRFIVHFFLIIIDSLKSVCITQKSYLHSKVPTQSLWIYTFYSDI